MVLLSCGEIKDFPILHSARNPKCSNEIKQKNTFPLAGEILIELLWIKWNLNFLMDIRNLHEIKRNGHIRHSTQAAVFISKWFVEKCHTKPMELVNRTSKYVVQRKSLGEFEDLNVWSDVWNQTSANYGSTIQWIFLKL